MTVKQAILLLTLISLTGCSHVIQTKTPKDALVITEPDKSSCAVTNSSLLVKSDKKSVIPSLPITGDTSVENKLKIYQDYMSKVTSNFVKEIDKHNMLVDTISCKGE